MTPMEVHQGNIVWANVVDQAGRNSKLRPAVVVSEDSDIENGAPVVLVAITSRFSLPLPDSKIELPHRPKPHRHPTTRLYRRSVAVCEWLLTVDKSAIDEVGGKVPSSVMDKILREINKRI